MTYFPRFVLSLLVALMLGIAPALGLLPVVAPLTAEAFNPPLHIAMFEQALGDKFSAEARGWVGEGLTRSDDNAAGQGRPEWHFDSANSPTVICSRWRAGPDALLAEAERQAVETFRIVPTDAPGFDRLGTHRAEALRLYGQYLHAIQDFYTHTNWIELHLDPTTQVTLTSIPPIAPIQQGCDVQALPKELQSGLFDFNTANLFATISGGSPDFCGPVTAPRPPQNSGFRYCHGPPHPETIEAILTSIPDYMVTMLNLQAGRDVSMRTLESKFMLSKDLPDLDHGAELLLRSDGTLATYHEEAVRLATEATPETLDVFQQRVVRTLGASPELRNRDPDCLFQVLLIGGDPTCPKRAGRLYQTDTHLIIGVDMMPTWYVALEVDPATNQIIGGELSWVFVNQGEGWTQTVNAALNVPPEGLVLGESPVEIEFPGTQTTHHVDGSRPDTMEEGTMGYFTVTVNDAGDIVLCPPQTADDGQKRRQECLASALSVLKPVGSEAPPIT
jgi:hypothetical protein